MGTARAPVTGSGRCPACTARVSKPNCRGGLLIAGSLDPPRRPPVRRPGAVPPPEQRGPDRPTAWAITRSVNGAVETSTTAVRLVVGHLVKGAPSPRPEPYPPVEAAPVGGPPPSALLHTSVLAQTITDPRGA